MRYHSYYLVRYNIPNSIIQHILIAPSKRLRAALVYSLESTCKGDYLIPSIGPVVLPGQFAAERILFTSRGGHD